MANEESKAMEHVGFRLPRETVAAMDELVEAGVYESRSEVLRYFLSFMPNIQTPEAQAYQKIRRILEADPSEVTLWLLFRQSLLALSDDARKWFASTYACFSREFAEEHGLQHNGVDFGELRDEIYKKISLFNGFKAEAQRIIPTPLLQGKSFQSVVNDLMGLMSAKAGHAIEMTEAAEEIESVLFVAKVWNKWDYKVSKALQRVLDTVDVEGGRITDPETFREALYEWVIFSVSTLSAGFARELVGRVLYSLTGEGEERPDIGLKELIESAEKLAKEE